MALDSLPPWLQISPRDFVLATQAGAQLGNTISEASQRAFENQQRMQMESKHQEQVQAQQAIENAMTRLAADRLENYRQQESANRQAQLGIEQKRLGSLDIQQQRADEIARRNAALEEAKAKAKTTGGVVTLPEAPGYTFIQNPSGVLTPLARPSRGIPDAEKMRLQIQAQNMFKLGPNELASDPSYGSRTNLAGGILRQLQSAKAPKRMVYNPTTKKVESVDEQGDQPDDGD